MAKHKISRKISPEDAEESQSRMSFGEHLEELRRRIMHALTIALLGVGLCITFMYRIFDWIARPYRIVAHFHHAPDLFTTLKPQEAFFTYITLACEAGLILTSPWIIYQLWKFIAAGLYQRERKIVYRYVGPSALLFLLGVAFFYFIVLPLTLNFFFSFTNHSAGPPPAPTWLERKLLQMDKDKQTAASAASAPAATQASPLATIPVLDADPPAPPPGQAIAFYNSAEAVFKIRTSDETFIIPVAPEGSYFTNVWRASDYLSFVAFTALIFGLAFEMPMVIVILAQIDLVQVQTFRNVRKYAYFGILVAAVIAAPSGDLMTLTCLFIPLIALYELGIVAAAFVTRGREKRA